MTGPRGHLPAPPLTGDPSVTSLLGERDGPRQQDTLVMCHSGRFWQCWHAAPYDTSFRLAETRHWCRVARAGRPATVADHGEAADGRALGRHPGGRTGSTAAESAVR